VTDATLKELAALTQLRELHVVDTWVTNDGIRDLQQVLPGLFVQRWD
jgi:hypothetical protein